MNFCLPIPLFIAQAPTPLPLGLVLIGITMFVGTLAFAAVMVALLLRHARHARELTHGERLRMIESGQPPLESDPNEMQKRSMHDAFWIAFWMVALGCGGSATAVAVSMSEPVMDHISVAIIAWICAAAASIASVICATILMTRSRPRSA